MRTSHKLASAFGLILWSTLSAADSDAAPPYIRQEFTRICPLPKCAGCPSDAQLVAPGVGFALETSYGTAVVRLHDGTYQDIAVIEGDASYMALMRNWANQTNHRTPDRLDSSWEKWQYAKKRANRQFNKLLGRPATPETAILATMVSKLLNATQTWLGEERSIVSAVLSSPERIRLTDEEVDDIFDYLQLKNLLSEPDWIDNLYGTTAAYAGYGRGLCRRYTDTDACEREEYYMPYQDVLHLDLNRQSLSGAIKVFQSADCWSASAAFIDFDLGSARAESRPAIATGEKYEGDETYWTAVSARIRELVLSCRSPITEILLTGPSVDSAAFKAALAAALHDVVAENALLILASDGVESVGEDKWKNLFHFATARGAAEFAKRRQEGPYRCAQTAECRERRERGRQVRLNVQIPEGVVLPSSESA